MINHKTLATAAALARNQKGATQQAHDLLAGYIKTLEAERDRYKGALVAIDGLIGWGAFGELAQIEKIVNEALK